MTNQESMLKITAKGDIVVECPVLDNDNDEARLKSTYEVACAFGRDDYLFKSDVNVESNRDTQASSKDKVLEYSAIVQGQYMNAQDLKDLWNQFKLLADKNRTEVLKYAEENIDKISQSVLFNSIARARGETADELAANTKENLEFAKIQHNAAKLASYIHTNEPAASQKEPEEPSLTLKLPYKTCNKIINLLKGTAKVETSQRIVNKSAKVQPQTTTSLPLSWMAISLVVGLILWPLVHMIAAAINGTKNKKKSKKPVLVSSTVKSTIQC